MKKELNATENMFSLNLMKNVFSVALSAKAPQPQGTGDGAQGPTAPRHWRWAPRPHSPKALAVGPKATQIPRHQYMGLIGNIWENIFFILIL